MKLAKARRDAKKCVKHNVQSRNGLEGISRQMLTSDFNDAILVRFKGEPPINDGKMIKGWRDIGTIAGGEIQMNLHRNHSYNRNNDDLRLATANEVIEIFVRHAIVGDRSLKNIALNMMMVPGQDNLEVSAYILKRYFLTKVKSADGGSEIILKKLVRLIVSSEKPNYEYHYDLNVNSFSKITDGYVVFHCRCYKAGACKCPSKVLVRLEHVLAMDEIAFSEIYVQVYEGIHFDSYCQYHESNRFSDRDINDILDDKMYVSDRDTYKRLMLSIRDFDRIEK